MATIKIGKQQVELKFLTKKAALEHISFCIKYHNLTIENNSRKIANKVIELDNEFYLAKNQKTVKKITITVEWKRSKMWGYSPKAEAHVINKDGTHSCYISSLISGCGYDKLSTSVAEVLNQCLTYKLMAKKVQNAAELPYGVSKGRQTILPYFESGVGIDSHIRAIEWLGGKMHSVASTDTVNVYEIKF